jgi:hypothetical protein
VLLKTKNPRIALTEDHVSLFMLRTCPPLRDSFLQKLAPVLDTINAIFNCMGTLLQALYVVKRGIYRISFVYQTVQQ